MGFPMKRTTKIPHGSPNQLRQQHRTTTTTTITRSFHAAVLALSSLAVSFLVLFATGGNTKFVSGAMITKTAASTSTTSGLASAKRVFCFGDSLTAGTSPPESALFPYGQHLSEALGERSAAAASTADVRWRGFPGWTASTLLTDAGLRGFLDRAAAENGGDDGAQPPPLDLVVVLAGTNDLAYATESGEIFESIRGIHEVARARGCPTIALGIPPSDWQSRSEPARSLAGDVNRRLESWAATTTTTKPKTTFVPFPIRDFDRSSGFWSPDGLHFSPRGYRAIGRSLAPIVGDLLWKPGGGGGGGEEEEAR